MLLQSSNKKGTEVGCHGRHLRWEPDDQKRVLDDLLVSSPVTTGLSAPEKSAGNSLPVRMFGKTTFNFEHLSPTSSSSTLQQTTSSALLCALHQLLLSRQIIHRLLTTIIMAITRIAKATAAVAAARVEKAKVTKAKAAKVKIAKAKVAKAGKSRAQRAFVEKDERGTLYVAAGVPPNPPKTHPKDSHAKDVKAFKAGKVKHLHDERYLCFVKDCGFGQNSHRSELSPHFADGAHPGVWYKPDKVIVAMWKDWIDDDGLKASTEATNKDEFELLLKKNTTSSSKSSAKVSAKSSTKSVSKPVSKPATRSSTKSF